jgi:hypothetical protein
MESQVKARPLRSSDVNWVVAQAARAPSVHNTQPWRFRWDADGCAFEVRADSTRRLDASDPHGRELTISCGAALVNLELALRQLGCDVSVAAFPDAASHDVLARVTVLDGPAASAADRALFGALARRHTHRGRFADRPIPAELAVRLQQAAWAQRCGLHYVHDAGSLARVLQLARSAERLGAFNDEVREETKEWTPSPQSARRDGVPARAYSQGPPVAGPGDLPGRDFDLERGIGAGERSHQPGSPIAVLTTEHDGPKDWLRAGQALESVLLTAATEWAFAAIHSQVTEVPHLRAEVQRELATAAYPQLLLRFGYADTAPSTPRRSPEEILDLRG